MRIAVIPGDGIGVDVTRESMRVLRRANEVFGAGLDFVEFDWGAEKYLREGIALPAGAFEMFRKDFQAILFGAVGDPRVPISATLRRSFSRCGLVWICTPTSDRYGCFTSVCVL